MSLFYQVYKTKTFSLSNVDKLRIDNYLYPYIFFSICDYDKLYFFYEQPDSRMSNSKTLFDFLNGINMVTICIETMTVVNNQILTDCIKFGTGGVMTQKESIQKINLKINDLEKLFFLKKEQKCFIDFPYYAEHLFLVFDIKNQYFYFVEDIIPNSKNFKNVYVRFTVDKDDLMYMYRRYHTNSGLRQEIRTFLYCNDKLIDAGIKWKDAVDHIYKYVKSICIV